MRFAHRFILVQAIFMEFLYVSCVVGCVLIAGSVALGSHAVAADHHAILGKTADFLTDNFSGTDSSDPLHSLQHTSSTEQVVSLQQAQDWALQAQPLQQLWQQRNRIAQANLLQSGQRLNPQLVFEQTGFKNTQEHELNIAIAQQLDIFGARKTRQQLAGLQLEQDSVSRVTDETQLKLAVAIAYWQLAQAEWALQLASTQQQLSLHSVTVAEKRLQAGRIAEVDYQRVQIAHQDQLRQWQAAQARCVLARQQLGQFWINSSPTINTQDFRTNQSPQLPKLELDSLQANLAQSPFWQRLRLQQQQAKTTLQLAKIQAKPQPTLSVGYVQSRESAMQNNTKQQRIALGLSIPLPLFQQNQGVMQAQQAVQQVNQLQANVQQQHIQQQIQQQWQALQAIYQQYDIVHDQQLPLSQQVQQKTLIGFEVGKFSVLEVQQASRDYQQLQAEQLRLLQQAWQLSFQLQALSLGLSSFEPSNENFINNFNQHISQSAVNLANDTMASTGINPDGE
ncbi:MAG: TolC family protein [Moraxellaceae bacterium]|nr:MAG: TolC family protein [Moraxellaceae bacterium]